MGEHEWVCPFCGSRWISEIEDGWFICNNCETAATEAGWQDYANKHAKNKALRESRERLRVALLNIHMGYSAVTKGEDLPGIIHKKARDARDAVTDADLEPWEEEQ